MALFDTSSRATKAFAEQRSSPRYATNCQAWIECRDRAQSRSCIIVDMSNGGARIAVASPYELPEELWLILALGRGPSLVMFASSGEPMAKSVWAMSASL
jgi:hypothetical protein